MDLLFLIPSTLVGGSDEVPGALHGSVVSTLPCRHGHGSHTSAFGTEPSRPRRRSVGGREQVRVPPSDPSGEDTDRGFRCLSGPSSPVRESSGFLGKDVGRRGR